MKPLLAINLVAIVIALAAPALAASCRHQAVGNCFKMPGTLDFSSVPDISNRIVGNETDTRTPRHPRIEQQPASEPYTGPMIGVANHVGAPEVGYYWSIH
jgi:hypothetical protein